MISADVLKEIHCGDTLYKHSKNYVGHVAYGTVVAKRGDKHGGVLSVLTSKGYSEIVSYMGDAKDASETGWYKSQ